MEQGSGRKERIKALFKKGQRCLVRYSDQYWAALIMRARKTDAGYYYLIHYDGWSKKHDEEVRQSEVIKYNPDLIGPIPGAEGDDEDGPGLLPSVKKRKLDASAGSLEVAVELRLHIPATLKTIIIQDYELVTQAGQLLPLPRSEHHRPTVHQILEEYRAQAAAELEAEEEDRDALGRSREERVAALVEATEGLGTYFDQTLVHYLLYQQEVSHHGEASAGGLAPSRLYGAEHLLRLLVKLPELMPVCHMGPQDAVNLEARLHHFMQYASGSAQARLFSNREQYIPNPDAAPELLLPPLPATANPTRAATPVPA
ncbi:hypothetical protein ACKKBF_B20095 [Auxenochlorella protothecoides x Auxenochlorella symbiontica]